MKRLIVLFAFLAVLAPVVSGQTVNSCDQVEYDSESQYLSGTTWHCALTSTESSISDISIEYSADDFEDLTGKALDDRSAFVRLEGGTTTNEVSYDFQLKQSEAGTVLPRDIHDFRTVKETLGGLGDAPTQTEKEQWARQNCYDFDYDGQIEYGEQPDFWTAAVTLTCLDLNQQYASAANIVDPEVHVGAEFTVNVDGETYTEELSNTYDAEDSDDSPTTATFGDVAFARFRGGLQTGEQVNQPANYKVLAAHANSFEDNWRMISEDRYDDYRGFLTSQLEQKMYAWGRGELDRDDLEQQTTAEAESAIEPYNKFGSPFANSNIDIDRQSLNDGGFSQTLGDLILLPITDFYFDGSGALQIEPQIGEPNIVSVQTAQFAEGETGQVAVSVKNVGNTEAGFTVGLSCQDGFRYGGIAKSVTLAEGEVDTLEFSITASSSSTDDREFSGRCTATMEESQTGKTDTWSFDVSAIQQGECVAGTRIAVEEDGQTVIKECDDNELDYSVVETCTEDEHAATQDGQLQCVEDEQPVIDPDIGDGGDEDTGDDDSTDTDGESCLIDTAIVSNPVGEDARLQLGCFDTGVLDRIRFVIILVSGLATGFVGFALGQWIDGERQIRGPNRYTKRRQVDRRQRGNRTSSTAILGGIIGFAVGAAIGWFLGLWAFLVIILLLVLKYISPF